MGSSPFLLVFIGLILLVWLCF
uniref:Uncharacterized protein n=1 Tax=Arundo donax TaxID=35708 RepID=A0A0A9C5W7_ARUDO